MNYVNVNKLNKDITENLYKIPRDIDIVVGIPRSGMLVATLVALYLNKPLSDLNAFLSKKIYNNGHTKNTENCVKSFHEIKKALIIDDSVSSGKSITEAKEKLNNAALDIELIYLSPYVVRESRKLVDIYFEIIEQPRIFEWNFIHHGGLMNACVDIDGVLCVDPTDEENDDGDKYIEFIKNAKPKYIPTRKVGYIVTSRLEKYRQYTEEWLKKQNIEYDKLIMMNVASAEERKRLNNHAEYKADMYLKCKKATWFIESEAWQAEKIAKISKKAVVCVENKVLYPESNINRAWQKMKSKIKTMIIKTAKAVIPERIYTYLKMRLKK